MLPPLLQPSKVSCFLATGHAAHSGALLWSSVDLEGGGRMLARCTGRILWSWNWYHVVVFFLSRGTDGHPGYSCCHQQRARGEHTWARFRPHLLQQFLPAVSVSVLQQPLQLPAVLHGLGCWLLCWGRGKSPWGLPCEEQPPEPPSALHAWPSRKPVAGRLLPREVTGCLKPHTCTYTQTSTRVHHYAKRVESFHSTHYTIFRHWLKGIVKKKAYICLHFEMSLSYLSVTLCEHPGARISYRSGLCVRPHLLQPRPHCGEELRECWTPPSGWCNRGGVFTLEGRCKVICLFARKKGERRTRSLLAGPPGEHLCLGTEVSLAYTTYVFLK